MDVSKLGALFPNPIKAQESSSMVLTIVKTCTKTLSPKTPKPNQVQIGSKTQ